MESLKKKHTLTFYRKMANTNPEIMKKYKSAVINRMSFKQLIKIYSDNNIKFEEDIGRLLIFKYSEEDKEVKINSDLEPIQEIKLKTNSDQNVKSIQEIELKTNLNNYILLSNSINKKYPYIKQNSITYTILNTKPNLINKNNNIYYSKFISLFKSMKEYFLNLR